MRADIVGRYAYYFNQDPNQGATGEAITYFVSEFKTNSKCHFLVNSIFVANEITFRRLFD